uniref:Uncharacterized protein n=1 Tax=Trichogramma kaykai TaxID=54128 RepID=A0ABD2X9N6_9HYME
MDNLRYLRDSIDWEVKAKRHELFDEFYRLLIDWDGRLSALQRIFRPEQLEILLSDTIDRWDIDQEDNQSARFIRFLVETGYKDNPKIDKDGKLMLHRHTPLFCAFDSPTDIHPFGRELFKIYDRFDVNYIEEETGCTHFHLACDWGYKDVVEKFLELGQDPNILVTETGSSPLHLALMSDDVDPEIVEILLRHGANPNVANKKGLTAVHLISMGPRDSDLMQMLIDLTDYKHQPVRIHLQDKNNGLIALEYAVARNFKNVTETLLKNGADPNYMGKFGSTPLHMVCLENNDVELAKILFKFGARIDVQNEHGYTPLHHAVYRGNESLVEFLLRNGADPNKAEIDGSTALHMICDGESDDAAFLEKFFKICKDTRQKLQIEARDNNGLTPLQFAVANVRPNMVDVLLDQGADLSSFIFPTAKQFDDVNSHQRFDWENKLKTASGLLIVVERLEKRGYELDRIDALIIMEFFTAYDLLASPNVEESWYDDEKFVIEAKKIMVNPSLSLYDLTRLQYQEAAKLLTYEDYLELWRLKKLCDLPECFKNDCAKHLCEKLTRRFFRSWTLYPFWEKIVHYRLPILCCDMIMEWLTNKDLFNICLTAHAK